MNILDKLKEAARVRLERDRKQRPLETLDLGTNDYPFVFEQTIRQEGISFICEVKKASPSKGIIADDFPYVDIAKEYEQIGASCISVLTETDYFHGSDEYLTQIKKNVSVPVLRKDFTIDPYQIYQAKSIGADAVLLICAILDSSKLKEFIKTADSLGLSSLVEAHDEDEVKMALSCGARVIGVNNRNLKTFDVDLQNSIRLREIVPRDIIFVSESGISTHSDVELLEQNNIDAVLIGESLMRSKNKRITFNELRGIRHD